jgi:hypothetical protein
MVASGGDILVQTRLPRVVAKWLKERAEREGDSIAGALRRLAVTEATRAVVASWVYHETQCDPAVVLARGALPHYHLKFLGDVAGGDVRFRLLTTNGRPVTGEAWRSTGYFPRLDEHRFVLTGDHRPWMIVSAWENALVNCMEVTLRPEERRIVAALRVQGDPRGPGVLAIVYSDGAVSNLRVGRQHDAYVYPLPGEALPQRPGWPVLLPEIVSRAMDAPIPG